mgnify:CR=1 FL=1|jgi:hypothetical protein
MDKLFFTETLKAENALTGPPNRISLEHKNIVAKNKKTSLSSFLQIIRKLETLSKTRSLFTKLLPPQQSRQAASP